MLGGIEKKQINVISFYFKINDCMALPDF